MRLLGALAGPLLPYLVGGALAALALGAWAINDRAYGRGVAAERATWQAAGRELLRLRQVRVDTAAAALAREQSRIGEAEQQEVIRVETRWRDRAAGPCLSDDSVRDLEATRVRILAAAASAGDDALPGGAAAAAGNR